MLTVGVDLAAEDTNTAVAKLIWDAGGCTVGDVRTGSSDEEILDALDAADKAGIDCPFGWPIPFIELLCAHRAGHVPIPAGAVGRDWRRTLTQRCTDRVVKERTGLTPLSVSADRIGHTAMRCALLLARLAERGQPVDRCGGGVVVEVYPAASLQQWRLPHRRYKRPANRVALGALIDQLQAAAPWLNLGPHEAVCRRSDDATDAVIAALTARAAAKQLTHSPSAEQVPTAAIEGWIALPNQPLDALPDSQHSGSAT